jgi:hypothetical protein
MAGFLVLIAAVQRPIDTAIDKASGDAAKTAMRKLWPCRIEK